MHGGDEEANSQLFRKVHVQKESGEQGALPPASRKLAQGCMLPWRPGWAAGTDTDLIRVVAEPGGVCEVESRASALCQGQRQNFWETPGASGY